MPLIKFRDFETTKLGWVSTKNGFPNDIGQVLCLGENGYVVRMYTNGDWFDEYGRSTKNVLGQIENISYWRPLPDGP